MPHAPVSEQHRHRAKHLRRAMTRAEILLWRYLKAHHLDGLAFRRQAPMGQYVIDFVCHAARLIVELDGEAHDFDAQQRRDAVRDAWLASRGYHVLRFTNEEVLCSLEGVLTVIRETAAVRIRSAPPSLSLPRRKGVHARLRRAMGGGNPQTTALPSGSAAPKRLLGAQK
jgi:very-short-patch-repair endonuclease